MKKITFFTSFDRNFNISLVASLSKLICEAGHMVLPKDGEKPDFAVVLGGDGTMLAAAKKYAASSVPLLGINLGKLGYLTDAEAENAMCALKKLLEGNYEIEHRMMLEAEVENCDAGALLALNDIVIHRGQNPRPIRIWLGINGEYVDEFTADGLVVASPTGSTAYNLSAGGPLIKPDAQIMAITPICPHLLGGRPVVVSDTDEIMIRIDRLPQTTIANDGKPISCEKLAGDTVSLKIKAAEATTKIVRTNNMNFYERFRAKLR